MDFILFCNLHYGKPYLNEFKKLARQHPDHSFNVVLSGRQLIDRKKGVPKGLRYFGYWVRKEMFRVGQSSEAGCLVEVVANINAPDFRNSIKFNSYGFCAGFDQIFNRRTIHSFKSLINFHPSLLPYYRGPIPSHWCLENGESYSGITAHLVETRIDRGDILYQKVVKIKPGYDASSLDRAIAFCGAKYFGALIESLVMGYKLPIKRVEARNFYKKLVDYKSFD